MKNYVNADYFFKLQKRKPYCREINRLFPEKFWRGKHLATSNKKDPRDKKSGEEDRVDFHERMLKAREQELHLKYDLPAQERIAFISVGTILTLACGGLFSTSLGPSSISCVPIPCPIFLLAFTIVGIALLLYGLVGKRIQS